MEVLGGVFGLVLAVLLFVLAAFWLIFPWMVYAQLKSMIEGLKRLEDSQSTMLHIFTKMEHHLDGIQSGLSLSRPLPTAAKPTRPDPHSFRYFFSRDGGDSGPHTLQQMLQFWQSGTLNAETLVVREGDSEWRAFSQFPEFGQP